MAAATPTPPRASFLTRFTNQSLKPLHPYSHQLLITPLLPPAVSAVTFKRQRPAPVISCVISGVDGGGVSDDFVSTRKSGFDREFSVIANMLKRIEPLDTSVISKGVSDSAKESMKQTISTMLGLLPSDQFSVTVRVSKLPRNRLLVSSVITGYTLWNAEYRILLMRNFDLSPDCSEGLSFLGECEVSEVKNEGCEDVCGESDDCREDVERMKLEYLEDLSPEALDYIQGLDSELYTVKHELEVQKPKNMHMEYIIKGNNDLLKYLRLLDSDMVTELSRPSSLEVEEVIHQLVQNIMQRFFKEENASDKLGESATGGQDHQNGSDYFCDTIGTSRDYLAKLLFWCTLLGHHLRGLENRVHLSCAVGLL